MFATFIEINPSDNSKVGTVYINPAHVVKVTRSPKTDAEKQFFATMITDINKVTTVVEGTPSDVRTALQSPRP